MLADKNGTAIYIMLLLHMSYYFVECILLTNNNDEKATAFAKMKGNTDTVNY